MTEAIKNAKAVLNNWSTFPQYNEALSALIDYAESLERQRDAVLGEEGQALLKRIRSNWGGYSSAEVVDLIESLAAQLAAELEAALERERVLRKALGTTASVLSRAANLIEEYVPSDALGHYSSSDPFEAHLTWSWPVIDEHIHGMRQTVENARAVLGKARKGEK